MFAEPLGSISLARGLIDDTGARHRRAHIRPLCGWQEAVIGGSAGDLDARSAHELLAACIERLGGYLEVTPEHTAELSRGDRDRLALYLRSMMFGDRLVLSPRCPNPLCGELAELDLSIDEILGVVPAPEPEWFEVDTPDGRARLRPPTGRDDEVCESTGTREERQALLWSRLLDRVGDRRAFAPEDWLALQTATRHAIALALAEASMAPDLSFLSRCPTCQALMELELDPLTLLARELRLVADRLLVEVHCLAFHYSWSEDQILNLPRNRRWRYLELLRNQLEGRPLVDSWSYS